LQGTGLGYSAGGTERGRRAGWASDECKARAPTSEVAGRRGQAWATSGASAATRPEPSAARAAGRDPTRPRRGRPI